MIKETINIPSTDWLRIELCPDYLNFITYSTDGSIQCLSSNYFNSRLLESDFYLPKHEETTNSIVSFFDASSGNVKSWLWDFGDGSTSTERDPQHIYTKMGWYKVSLTIKDSVSQSVIAKDSIIHILDLDTAKTPNFNRIGEFNTQLSDIINLNFSSGSKELFAIPNAKNISIFDVVNNKIKNEIFLKEQFESIALSNDQKNILGFKSMNDIYYLDLKNDSVLFTKKIKNVADDAIVPVQIAFQTKEMQYSKSDVFMLPGDTSFICTYQYNYHLHTVSPPTNNYGEIVGASAYAFNIDPIMPMHLDTKNNITYQSAVYSARTRAFAISYKINTGKFCVKVVREDSTKTFTKQFPGDYAILLAFTNKSKQLVYTDNNNAVRMISIEDTNNTSLIAQNLTKPTAITVSNDDKYVIVGYEDGNIRLLDINAGVFVDSMKAPYAISNLVISDSGYLAVALVTGKVYIVKNTKFLEAAAIVSEQSVISDIIIYPNPCENQAKIEFNMNETGNVKIKLINFIGEDVKLIISKPIVKGCSFIEFNTSDLPIGIYFLQVQSGNNIQSIKFIKN
jgi:PKD repeat protein